MTSSSRSDTVAVDESVLFTILRPFMATSDQGTLDDASEKEKNGRDKESRDLVALNQPQGFYHYGRHDRLPRPACRSYADRGFRGSPRRLCARARRAGADLAELGRRRSSANGPR